ncbi:hypothetical protein [Ancylobacter sp. IITR112]|uniref:hypothetical protein n=1 Tax=Ancylobacter sp. IITR112 TaxID=3138073 RepID=UPI00352A6A90
MMPPSVTKLGGIAHFGPYRELAMISAVRAQDMGKVRGIADIDKNQSNEFKKSGEACFRYF